MNIVRNSLNRVKILRVPFSSTHINRLLREVWVRVGKFEYKERSFDPLVITTPNPEIILKAQSDLKLLEFIEKSDFAVPDGVGVLLADFFLRLKVPKRPFSFFVLPFYWIYTLAIFVLRGEKISSLKLIKGRALFERLIALANRKAWRVVFLGDGEGSAQKAAEVLRVNHKKVKIFPFVGPLLDDEGRPVDIQSKNLEVDLLASINKIRPHLLFIAFGAPKQERWLGRNLSKINIGVAMVVGGTFDYISGKVKRPPLFFENRGLEWLWRLLVQPYRLGRIFKAVFVFPLKLIFYKAGK